MHPSFDQLLSLRESDAPEDEVAVHVRNCAECHATVESARSITSRLRDLPVNVAAHRFVGWRFAPRFSRRPQLLGTLARRPGWFLPAASAALVLCAVVLTVSSHGPRQGSIPRSATATDAPDIAAPPQQLLVAESQRLEAMLATCRGDARHSCWHCVDGRGSRGPDSLGRLSTQHGERSRINPRQEDLLWRERVELLNSLVAVRYADARMRAF